MKKVLMLVLSLILFISITTIYAINANAVNLQEYFEVDYDSLPETDAFYSASDLNNSFAWVKNGYRAEIVGADECPFKYVPSLRSSNGFGFKIDVPIDKAKCVVIRYHTNVVERKLRFAYSCDDTYDFNNQYGQVEVTNASDQRTALVDMSNVVSTAKSADVSSIEYFKILPWQGKSWTGEDTISDNYFNIYSVAFFENSEDAKAYQAALEAALPPIESEKKYDNSGAMEMEGVNVDSTSLNNMISAFKEKEKDFANRENKLVIYPEYPERIGRNYDYSVKVSQGGELYPIPVYNELRQGESTRNFSEDEYRRFCEFAFQGEPVRIDITVNMSFSEYTIIPAAKNIPSTVNGNVISLYVSEPMQLIVRLGNGLNSNNTNLAIFVDPPEENVPDKNDPDVIYIEGWYEEEDNELNITKNGTTVYIAPGAVCNARILSDGNDDVTIIGRGMVRDPHDTRSANVHGYNNIINVRNGKNIRVDGIKIVDCSFYHLYFAKVNIAEIYNVKLLSNLISTDGFAISSATNLYLHDSYAYIGDNVFTGSGTKKYYEDILVGTSCGVFALSGIRSNEVYKDINIFRADEVIFNNTSGSSGIFIGATFENIFSVDCPFTPYFILSKNQGEDAKKFIFKNVSLKAPSGVTSKNTPFNSYTGTVVDIQNGDSYVFDFENIYIDGELITSPNRIKQVDNSASGAVMNVTTNPKTQSHIPLKTNTTVLEKPYVAPKKTPEPLGNGENLIRNGNFESGVNPWTCKDFSYIYLTDDANSGENSLYIPAYQKESGEEQRGGIDIHLTDEINRGGVGQYLIEFYAKKAPESEGSKVAAHLKYYYGEITETTKLTGKQFVHSVFLTDEWQKYSYVVTIPSDELDLVTLSIVRGSGDDYPPINFYVDDISMVKFPVTKGDTNNDGRVTPVDLVHLARYIAGWNGYEKCANIANSDYNEDLKVSSLDLVYISRHMALWEGYESLFPTQ